VRQANSWEVIRTCIDERNRAKRAFSHHGSDRVSPDHSQGSMVGFVVQPSRLHT